MVIMHTIQNDLFGHLDRFSTPTWPKVRPRNECAGVLWILVNSERCDTAPPKDSSMQLSRDLSDPPRYNGGA